MWLAALIVLLFLPSVQAKPRYFMSANLVSMEDRGGEYRYLFDAPLGVFAVRRKQSRHQPRLSTGEVRIAVERNAEAGGSLYFLDRDGKSYKTVIVEVMSHPPPPALF